MLAHELCRIDARRIVRAIAMRLVFSRGATQAAVAHHDAKAKLTRADIQSAVQGLVTPETTIFAETGDSWFNVMRMNLPRGARVELEMQWGHIGWSVPATFGYAVGTPRVLWW